MKEKDTDRSNRPLADFIQRIGTTLPVISRCILVLAIYMTDATAFAQELYNHALQNPFANYEEDLEAAIENFKEKSGFDVQVITAYEYGDGQFGDYVQSWRQSSTSSGLLVALNPMGTDWSNDLKVVGAQDMLESDQFNASGIQSVVDEIMVPILKEEDLTITNDQGEEEELSFGAGLKYYKSIEIGLAEMLRRAPMTEVEVELPIVRFVPNPNQTYGFDERDEEMPYGQYEQTTINGETQYIPWKSIASGSSDQLDVHIQTLGNDVTAAEVKYKTQTTALQGQSGSSDDLKTLNLIGQFDGQEDDLQAYYTYPDESEVQLSTIRVKTYDQKRFNLVVVPVDGNSFPYNFSHLSTQLNKTFNQAVVQWDLSLNNPVATDLNPNQAFDDGQTGMLSNYTGDMKTVWRAFKDQYTKDNETYYLFLVRNPQSGSKIGYMPKKKQYGFVFLDNIHSEQHLVKTIAHELGHGAFRLSHPFSDYGHADRATSNLMDYKDEGLTLKKYQWDFIHDPENMIALFQDEEEGAMEDDDNLEYVYFVTDDDAWYRVSESPYTPIKPTEENPKLPLGTQVAVLGLLKNNSVAKMKIKGETEFTYTSFANLTKIETLSDEPEYKMAKPYESVKLPYNATKADKTYEKNATFKARAKCGNYLKVKGEGGNIEGHWININMAAEGNPDYPISVDLLKDTFKDTPEETLQKMVDLVNKYSTDFEINSKERMAHFLAQTGHETAGFKKLGESCYYSKANSQLKSFSRYQTSTSLTIALTEGLEEKTLLIQMRNPDLLEDLTEDDHFYFNSGKVKIYKIVDEASEAEYTYENSYNSGNGIKEKYVGNSAPDCPLFDYVYCCNKADLGNGDVTSKDGSRFRGRGYIHLTGRYNYNKDFYEPWKEEYPDDTRTLSSLADLIRTDKDLAMKAAMIYWKGKGLNEISDNPNELSNDKIAKEVTSIINSGLSGLDERQQYFSDLKSEL